VDKNKVALIDLDGTVADFDKSMSVQLKLLESPGEKDLIVDSVCDSPTYIQARRDLIKNQSGFWRNLERIELGFQIVEDLRSTGFSLHVLTKAPSKGLQAWTEKAQWCEANLPDASISITHDKSLVYGRILVDDYPPYFEEWLKWRPRGLVICVAQPWNHNSYGLPNVFRYDGANRMLMRAAIYEAYNR
jgi:5'(3')-deoxyribonucleotidase